MNYQILARNDGVNYNALGTAGTVFYSTLMAAQSRVLVIPAAQRIRVVGNASCGAILDFSIVRFIDCQTGGYIPS